MKIVYIPPKSKEQQIRLYSSTATALLAYLPLASYNSHLTLFIVLTAIVFMAYLIHVLGTLNKKITNPNSTKTLSVNIQDNKDCTITINAYC